MDYEDVRRFVTACHTTPKMSDTVNQPPHYMKSEDGVECIEGIRSSMSKDAFRGYLKGNIMKYLWRYEDKQCPVTDLRKARWYLEALLEACTDVPPKTAKSPYKPQVSLSDASKKTS